MSVQELLQRVQCVITHVGKTLHFVSFFSSSTTSDGQSERAVVSLASGEYVRRPGKPPPCSPIPYLVPSSCHQLGQECVVGDVLLGCVCF